jgi:hypothetical protein
MHHESFVLFYKISPAKMMSLNCLGLNNSLTTYTYSQRKTLVNVKRVSGIGRNLVDLNLHRG